MSHTEIQASSANTIDDRTLISNEGDGNTTGAHLDRDKLIAALPDVVDQAMREALPHRYTPELANQIAETMTGILTGALCPVWPSLCTDTSVGHLVHLNREHKVTDKQGESLLDVAFLQFTDDVADGPAVICIGAEDFDPSEVKTKTAEIRRLLDQADAMADKVTALRP